MPSNTQQLLGTINESLTTLQSGVNSVQSNLYDTTLRNISRLEYDINNRLIQNTRNTKILGQLKTDLDKILRSREYTGAVKKFGKHFDFVEQLQNDWFSNLVDDFKPSGASKIAKRTAITSMVDNMVGGGVNQAVTVEAGDLLLRHMQTGASIRQVNDQLRTFMIGNRSVPGRLQAYTGQIAVDSINQYSRSYAQQTSEDLGFEWYQYVGRVKDTTRPFCRAMVKQRYIHKSELGKASVGELRIGKVSTEGFIKDTNAKNIITNAGGYRCNHQFRPVSSNNVPLDVRNAVADKKPLPKTPPPVSKTPPKPTVIKEEVGGIVPGAMKHPWEYQENPKVRKNDSIDWELPDDVFYRYKKVQEIEKSISGKHLENLYIFDQHGKQLAHGRGNQTSVRFPDKILNYPGGTIITHNHPSGASKKPGEIGYEGKSLSLADVMIANRINAREIRAVTNKTRYILRRSKGTFSASYFQNHIEPAYKKANKFVKSIFEQRIANDDISIDWANFNHDNEVWKNVANQIPDLLYLKF